MARFALVLSLFALSSASVPGDIDIEGLLNDLWTQTDTDGNGALSEAEWENALTTLGIVVSTDTVGPPPCTLCDHASPAALFAELNTDTSTGLTPAELAGAITLFPQYQAPLMASFTNGAGAPPDPAQMVDQATPTEAMNEATATVSIEMVVSGPPSSIYPGTRTQIKQYFADQCSVDLSSVILTFTVAEEDTFSTRRKLSRDPKLRRLQAGNTQVDATVFVADDAAALAASNNLPDNAADMGAVPAFSGLTISEMTPAEPAPRVPVVETGPIGGLVVGLFVMSILVCILACCWSKKLRTTGPVEVPGCCTDGCCSYNAVGPWALGQFGMAMVVVGCVAFLYQRMQIVADAMLGLRIAALDILNTDVQQIAVMVEQIPPDVENYLEQYGEQFALIPAGTAVPGFLAFAFLLFASLCASVPMRKGSYCCTKCMILLAVPFIWWAIIFYLIFAVAAAALTYPPPGVATHINQVRGMCITVPAMLNQMVTDNVQALNQLEALGQDVSTMTLPGTDTPISETITQIQDLVGSLSDGCDYLTQFLDGMMRVFLPCIMSVIALFWSLYQNNQLCCVTGCCGSPPAEPNPPEGKAGGVELKAGEGADKV